MGGEGEEEAAESELDDMMGAVAAKKEEGGSRQETASMACVVMVGWYSGRRTEEFLGCREIGGGAAIKIKLLSCSAPFWAK